MAAKDEEIAMLTAQLEKMLTPSEGMPPSENNEK
jgi:hypothetical protein